MITRAADVLRSRQGPAPSPVMRRPFTTPAHHGARTVYVTRHARTAANAARRIAGWTNPPITPEGRSEIHTAAKWWADRPIDWVISSPLERCSATATLLFGRLDDIDAAFTEQAVPGLEGLPVDRAHRLTPELCRADGWSRPDAPRDPRSEHLDTITSRVLAALRGAAAAVPAGRSVAVVTHGAVVVSVLRAAGVPAATAGNLTVVELTVDPETGWDLDAVHDPLQGR